MSIESTEQLLKLEKEAKIGSVDAQFTLGIMYSKEAEKISPQSFFDQMHIVKDQNYKNAFKWYKKAAKQGHSEAQNNLGVMYTHGNGTSTDYDEAIKWYIKSSKQGNLIAQNNITKTQELRRSSKKRGLIGWLLTTLFMGAGG